MTAAIRIDVPADANCRLASDGGRICLDFVDATGAPVRVTLPGAAIGALIRLLAEVSEAAGRNPFFPSVPQLAVRGVDQWRLDRADDPAFLTLTILSADHREDSYAIRDEAMAKLAALIGEYHVEAFPDGLVFQ